MESSSTRADSSEPGGILAIIKGPFVRKWLGRGSWAIADQAIYGLSTFLINVLLGTWVSKAEYGAFAIAFSALILLLAVYNAIFVEPMLVFGSSRYNSQFRQYLKALLKGHGLFSILSSTVLGLSAIVLYQQNADLGAAIFGLAIATPFILLAWLARRACYVNHNPRLATFGGTVSLAVVLIVLVVLDWQGALSSFTALGAMGAGGLVSGVFLLIQMKVGLPGRGFGRFARTVTKRHWVYGRWALAARVPMRVPRIIILSFLPIWAGLEATGTLQALSNPIMPVVQVIGAISLLLIPTLSRERESNRFFRITASMFVLFVGITGISWALLGIFNGEIISLLYSGNYSEDSHLLWYLAVQPVFTAIVSVLSAGFSAVEKPKFVFWAYFIGTLIGLPITIFLMSTHQLVGAIVGSIVMNFITSAVLCIFFVFLKIRFDRVPSIQSE
ncbi:MAG: hypothetical protein HKN43_01245 [Rhodothermales bacterium]|nr:hypothetical protein [Rhodothermales bacterium]